jgi:hypothetical protein
MGGGLFGTPLALNPKCLVFSLCILIVYWMPHPPSIFHEFVMGFLLATSAYISIAWYDVLYNCNDRLKPTLFGWLSKSFKPPEYSAEYDKLPLQTKKTIRMVDITVLIIVFITFLYPFFFTYPSFSFFSLFKKYK